MCLFQHMPFCGPKVCQCYGSVPGEYRWGVRIFHKITLTFRFGVEDYMVEPFLEGMTLPEALMKNKIFMTDVGLVEDIPLTTGEKVREERL